MNRFSNCTTLEQAKGLYKALVRENHPDTGGDTRTMQDINAEYADFLKNFATSEARTRQSTAHAENRKSAADFHDLDEVGEKIRIMIEFALNLDGVEIELMGLWVWLTGNTKAHVQTFKDWNEAHEIKWRWMHKKQAWVYAGVPSFNRKEKSLDEIRDTYGSQKFSRERNAESMAGALHA